MTISNLESSFWRNIKNQQNVRPVWRRSLRVAGSLYAGLTRSKLVLECS